MVVLSVDYENNSETFWNAFHEAFPQFCGSKDTFSVTQQEFQQIQRLEGWDDPNAPYFAPHPLIAKYEGSITAKMLKLIAEDCNGHTYELEAWEYPNGVCEVSYGADHVPCWYSTLEDVWGFGDDPIIDCQTVEFSQISLEEIAKSIDGSSRAYGDYPALKKAWELFQF